MGCASSRVPGEPAKALTGIWRPTKLEEWNFHLATYGDRWEAFKDLVGGREGAGDQDVHMPVDERGTFFYQYGIVASGSGRWLHGNEEDSFFAESTMLSVANQAFEGMDTRSLDPAFADTKAKHVGQLITGPNPALKNVLKVITLFTEGPATGRSVTEYYIRD